MARNSDGWTVLAAIVFFVVIVRRADGTAMQFPANTGVSVFASVAGNVQGSDVYWSAQCKLIPPNALFLMLDLGGIRDFYKPRSGISFCDMLQAKNKHQWSYDAISWKTPAYEPNWTCRGGSAMWWPRDHGRHGDNRAHLSYWGDMWNPPNSALKGGCCGSTYSDAALQIHPNDGGGWYKDFTMSFAIQLQPLPPDVGMSLVVNVAGTTKANDAFWAEQCKTIPASTLFLVLDMGAVRDFFKPVAGVTYCEMLQARNKHQWSSDGLTWVTPDFLSFGQGGSATNWPRDNGRAGDERKHLSFWGDDGNLVGGCCSTSTATHTTGSLWGKSCK